MCPTYCKLSDGLTLSVTLLGAKLFLPITLKGAGVSLSEKSSGDAMKLVIYLSGSILAA